VQSLVEQCGVESVIPAKIHAQAVDVFSPCALGGIINDQTLPEIKAKVVCGVANNQLEGESHGDALQAAGITYVPDYVVNAGGIMGAGAMIYSNPTMDDSRKKATGLYDTVLNLLAKAKAENRPTAVVADEMARVRIRAGRRD